MKGKFRTRWAVWVVAAAAGVVSPVQAQNTNTNVLSQASEKSIGHIERADKIIGREVRNPAGQRIGKVEDLAVELELGRALYAVVSVGGFLGVGDRQIPIPTSAFTETGNRLQLPVDKERLMQAPEFSTSADKHEKMLSPQFASQVYQFFGESGWFVEAGATGKPFGNPQLVSDLKGMKVRSSSDEPLGEVEAIAMDLQAARTPYVFLQPDRSLNMKNKLLAMPPEALRPSADKKVLSTGEDREQLTSAPNFDKNNWPDLSNPAWASRVYKYYGKQPYFENGQLQPTGSTNSQERIYHEPQKPSP